MNKPIFYCNQLSKTYHDGTAKITVLKEINLTVNKGERIAIIGPSGSGKSTLLHLLGGLDIPTQGEVLMQGVNWQTISEKKRCTIRNRQLGFIYQFHHLLPEFSALENVALPLLIRHDNKDDAMKKAATMLAEVGLSNRLHHKPSQLSGGERQRVAIARALVHEPSCVLADEPTGNLDNLTAVKVFELMLGLNKKLSTALIIVTHDEQLAHKMDRVLTIHNGMI